MFVLEQVFVLFKIFFKFKRLNILFQNFEMKLEGFNNIHPSEGKKARK